MITRACVTWVVLAAASVVPTDAVAQSGRGGPPIITGSLSDTLSSAPVEGAMVVLLDLEGRIVERTMTGADGAFALAAPRAGRFVLRADRIGHESTLSAELNLARGDTAHLPMVADVRAIRLAGIDVEADPRCVLRPEEGRSVARLWGEARKALESARWTANHGLYQYEFVEFDRVWDGNRRSISNQRLRRRVENSQALFGSVPVDVLMSEGFVVEEGDAWVYRGPDADVLLSDPFLDTHCFRIGRREGESELIALEFEPVARPEHSEIEGVLWVDRQNAELHSIDYRYVNLERDWGGRRFGGTIEFDRLPTGPSIIRRWTIWMPSLQHVFGQRRARFSGIREQGAEVMAIRSPTEAILEYPAGRLSGRVLRGPDQRPVADVIVSLDGVDAWSETDSTGAYDIDGLIAGPYTLRVHDEALSHVGRELPPSLIRIEADARSNASTVVQDLYLEDPQQVLFEYCGRFRDFAVTAVLLGRVRSDDQASLIEDARVNVAWIEPGGRARDRDARSDDRGFYVVCGIPRQARVTVSVEKDRQRSPSIGIDVPARATEVIVDLSVPPGLSPPSPVN